MIRIPTAQRGLLGQYGETRPGGPLGGLPGGPASEMFTWTKGNAIVKEYDLLEEGAGTRQVVSPRSASRLTRLVDELPLPGDPPERVDEAIGAKNPGEAQEPRRQACDLRRMVQVLGRTGRTRPLRTARGRRARPGTNDIETIQSP